MSFLTRHPGIPVADHRSRYCGRMRTKALASPAVRFAEPEDYVSDLPRVSAAPEAAIDDDDCRPNRDMPTSDSYMTAEIAAAITAN
jgi:hypothetical protein